MFRLVTPPDGFSTTNVPLRTPIEFAWGVNADRIYAAPSWIDDANYDIEAKVDDADVPTMESLTPYQRREMVRKLLEDRFALKVHEETRELSVYALVVAKGGPKLHDAKPGDTYPNGFKGPGGKSGTGAMTFNGRQLIAQGLPIGSLTNILSQQTGRTVIDKTGLTGKYDFTLDLPAGLSPMPIVKPPEGVEGAADSAPGDSGPSIFTLVQDQLGLKLESTKAPLPILVIDHVEQPSPN
jgi:bla regulator protein blaR1